MIGNGALGAGIVLIGTHFVTSLLQCDPLAAQLFLERHTSSPLSVDWLLLGCTLGFLGIWLFQAFVGISARDLLNLAHDRLSCVLGRPGAVLFFAAFLVPMRQMESNSGYVNISPESLLAWLLLLLDVLRSLASLRLTIAFLTYGSSSPESSSARPSNLSLPSSASPSFASSSNSSSSNFFSSLPSGTGLPRRFFFGPLLAGLAIAIATQFGPLENIPHVQDEIIQDWQARTLSAGMIHASPIPERQSFQTDRLDDNGSWLHSSYQPALSIIWSLFLPFNGIGLVNPLLGILCLLLWRDLVTKATDQTIGTLASSLLAVSPFFWIMAAGRMNHLLALFLLLAVARSLIMAQKGRLLRGALLAGLACGVFFMTRRVDAIVTIMALQITILSLSSRPLAHRFGFVLLSCILTGFVFFIQTTFARAASGDALSMVRWGQVVARNWWEIPSGALFANFLDSISGFSFFAFGGAITGLAGFLFLRPSSSPFDRFFVIQSAATVAAYGLYDFQDYCYGPRFWFNLLPAATLGLACGLQALSKSLPSHNSSPWPTLRPWFFCAAAFALLTMVHQAQAVFNREYWHVDRRFEQLISTLPTPTLIFLESPTRRVLRTVRELCRHGISPEETSPVATPGFDTAALCEESASFSLGLEGRDATLAALSMHREAALQRSPESSEINRIEVIRLNGPNPLSQGRVVALDLGDKANEVLRLRLPKHVPLIACRQGASLTLVPYVLSGIAEFRDADGL
ncbi:MAG: glycosyltransferase family 39 protein [Candidatus Ozemobacteraceae bacterium]